MAVVDALERSFEHAHTVIADVRPDQYDDPTPCPEWTVRTLVEHIVGVVAQLGAAAAGRETHEELALAPDPAAQFADVAKSAIAAWRAPGAMEAVITGPVGRLPGQVHATINLLETATHSWDLATATGQPAELPADVAHVALDAALLLIAPELRANLFADEVPVGAGASTTEQLVAFLGRSP